MLTTSVQVYPSVHLQSLKGPCLSPHFSHGFFTQAGGVLGVGLVLGLVLGLGLALGVGLALGPGLVLGDSAGDGLAAGFWHLYSSSCTQGQDRNTMLGNRPRLLTVHCHLVGKQRHVTYVASYMFHGESQSTENRDCSKRRQSF